LGQVAKELATAGAALGGFTDIWKLWADAKARAEERFSQNAMPQGSAMPQDTNIVPMANGRTVRLELDVNGISNLPEDRGKLQELARALWREAELSGLRAT
jgi:hypothetical protein